MLSFNDLHIHWDFKYLRI